MMKTPGIFVTGTNTEVGKTVVSRAILAALHRRGLKPVALKPVESGAAQVGDTLVPADALSLTRAAKRDESDLESVCCYCFADPVSPHLAAARAGTAIAPEPILALCEQAAQRGNPVLAEGAGGFLVPLSDQLLYAEVIARTGFALLLVAPNVLGTINATLLTIEAARQRQIPLLGVVLNRTPPIALGNAEAIATHGQVPILGQFPDAPVDEDDQLAELAEQHLDLDHIVDVFS